MPQNILGCASQSVISNQVPCDLERRNLRQGDAAICLQAINPTFEYLPRRAARYAPLHGMTSRKG